MALSKRIRGLNAGGDDGWGVYYRARAMAAAGAPVINLTIGDHDAPTPGPILDAMASSAAGGNTGYAPVPGSEALRQAIASRATARTGVRTGPENVLVTAGGQAALFAAHIALLDPGDAALMIDPYYATYPGTIRAASARPVPVLADAAEGFQPDAAVLDRAAKGSGARSLLINTPNNPTGAVYAAETLTGIAAVAAQHGLWVIADEVYESQVWEGQHHSIRALPGMAEQSLVVGSFSKSHRMTGARIGWIIGPEPAIAAMAELATNTTYGVAGFVQDAALAALEAGPALEADVAETYRSRRQSALSALNGLTVRPCQGGMFLMLDVSASGESGQGFAARLLDEAGVAVMPGESFGMGAAGHVRIALTVAEPLLLEALARLRTTLAGQSRRRA